MELQRLFECLGENRVTFQLRHACDALTQQCGGARPAAPPAVMHRPLAVTAVPDEVKHIDQQSIQECCVELGGPPDLRDRLSIECLQDAPWRRALRRRGQDQEMVELLSSGQLDELFRKHAHCFQHLSALCACTLVVFDGFEKRVYAGLSGSPESRVRWALLRASPSGSFSVLCLDGEAQVAAALTAIVRDMHDLNANLRAADVARLCRLLDIDARKKGKDELVGLLRARLHGQSQIE
jgi:hypothetical protein